MNRIIIAFVLLLFHFSCISQNKELKKLYAKGKFDQVIVKAQQLLAENNTDPDINSILGRAFTQAKQFKKAIPYLEKSIASDFASDQTKALSKAYLAKCLFVQDEMKQATSYLKECQLDRSSRKVIKYAVKYARLFQNGIYYKGWKLKESKNVRFHFQNKKLAETAGDYMQQIQVQYKRIVSFLDAEPSKKIDFYIWTDRSEAYRKFDRSLSFWNSELCTINIWEEQNDQFELCDMLCDFALRSKFKSLLIQKGLGAYFQKMDQNLMSWARSELKGEQFSLIELWEEPTRYKRNLSTPVGAAFVEFLLNKRGAAKLKQLLEIQTIKRAHEVYPDFEQLVKTFEAMLIRS